MLINPETRDELNLLILIIFLINIKFILEVTVTLRTPKQQLVFDMFRGLCVLCFNDCSGIHEIVPRSDIPKDWDEIDNMVPLCSPCHERVQSNPAAHRTQLEHQRDYLLQVFSPD